MERSSRYALCLLVGAAWTAAAGPAPMRTVAGAVGGVERFARNLILDPASIRPDRICHAGAIGGATPMPVWGPCRAAARKERV